MEGPAQSSLFPEVGRRITQCLDRRQTSLHDLTRLFEEDVAHFCFFVVESTRRHRCNNGRYWQRRDRRNGCRHRRHGGRGRSRHGFGRSFGRRRLARGRRFHRRPVAPHDRPQFTELVVVHEELLGQSALVAQHVDQEPHRPEAVAKLLEYTSAVAAHIDVIHQEFFDAVAHAQCRHRRLVQAQNRKHTAHLRQLAGHFVQRNPVLRIPEELVERFFDLPERGVQLIHHAAHRLAVTDPAVQVLHPSLHGLGLRAGEHPIEPLRKPCAPLGHLRLGRIEVVISGFEIQDRSRHLHRDRGRRRLTQSYRGFDHPCQGARQFRAFRMKLQHRIGNRGELVRCGLEPIGIAARQRRPGLGRGCNAFSGLHQQGGVKSTELRFGVVHRPGLGKAVGLANGNQCRRIGRRDGHRLGTEEQQVLRKPVDHARLAAGQRGVLGDGA